MNENGGKGLFYGVIGVATLIVAIIGATFAWFTATANSGNKTLVTTGTLTITYTEGTSLIATNLKPATAEQVLAAYNAGNCKFQNGAIDEAPAEQICTLYRFTVANTGTLQADLTATATGFAVTPTDSRSVNTNVTGDTGETAVTTAQEQAAGNFKYSLFTEATKPTTALVGSSLAAATTLTLTPSTLAKSGSQEYIMLVWLDSAANNSYQGVKASATITVTAAQTNVTP